MEPTQEQAFAIIDSLQGERIRPDLKAQWVLGAPGVRYWVFGVHLHQQRAA